MSSEFTDYISFVVLSTIAAGFIGGAASLGWHLAARWLA